jgi:V/A-type H+-transporting ATPase subunit F
MNSYVISDDQDILTGMRLAGIKGVLVASREQALEQLQRTFGNDQVQIVIITESVLKMAEEEIMKFKLERTYPLIVEIPGLQGPERGDYIAGYVREAIGLKI